MTCSVLVFGYELTLCFVVSSGFATIHPDSTLNINVLEAVTLEDIDREVCYFYDHDDCS